MDTDLPLDTNDPCSSVAAFKAGVDAYGAALRTFPHKLLVETNSQSTWDVCRVDRRNANTYRYSTSDGGSHYHRVIGVAAGHSLCNGDEAGTACFSTRNTAKARAEGQAEKPTSRSKNGPR